MNTAAPEGVIHPKHYNSHPSGVEAIEIADHLGFCLGSALKYVFRLGMKDDNVKELRKAEFYVVRTMNFMPRRGNVCPETLCQLIEMVVANEPDADKAVFFAEVAKARFAMSRDARIDACDKALKALQALIAKETSGAPVQI